MKSQWIPISVDETKVARLKTVLNLPPTFCRLLIQRGIDTKEKADQFFNPSLNDLHDPFTMQGMGAAVARLKRAINRKEHILLYGDYDVDGTCSVAMMYTFLEKRHENLDFYIPDRYKEGYGISMQGVDYASQNGVTLIIAMDCGIKAVKEVEAASKKGIDFIICDHHEPEDKRPPAVAVLDPKQKNCTYPYKDLCGCGVTFKLIQAYCQHQGIAFKNIAPLLDLMVVAIACDIVPMTGENRVLAYYGLKILNKNPRLGLAKLIAQTNRNPNLTITDIVFGIGPLLNAAGRLGDAKQAVKLLLAKDIAVAEEYTLLLAKQNQQRKSFDQSIVEEAELLIEEMTDLEERKSIVLFQKHWHKGVIGIAASRIVERYSRPSIIFTESNGKIVGSARSVRGFDIYQAIRSCEEFLLNFGGHQYAAGITMEKENLQAFAQHFEAVVNENLSNSSPLTQFEIGTELPLSAINASFWAILKKFAPFGPKNHNPLFMSRKVMDTGYSKLLKGKHLRLSLHRDFAKPVNGIAFNQDEHLDKIREYPFDICYQIHENHWNGKTSLQLHVKDLKFGTV